MENKALTGEWIVYAKHEGKNYYLCLGKPHENNTYEKIKMVIKYDFPFLQLFIN